MAEKQNPIQPYADKYFGGDISKAIKDLEKLNKEFSQLYEQGPFDTGFDGDLDVHKAMGARFKAEPELFRAFDSWRRLPENGGKSVKSILQKAADGFAGMARNRREFQDSMPWGEDFAGDYDKFIFESYPFVPTGDGGYVEEFSQDQAADDLADKLNEVAPKTDAQAEKERREDEIDQMRAEQDAMQQGRQGQNVFLDKDPQIGAVRQQVRAAADNPFLFGTEGNQSQIEDLLDKSSRKIPTPNRSDARSVANFNDAFSSREFVRDAAFRKQRELANLDRNRRNLVNSQGMQDTMMKWIAANPDHEMSEKGLANWTDQDKISFVKNFKLGNFDDPAPAKAQEVDPRGVPMFDKDGRMGFVPHAEHTPDKPGQKFKVNMDQPNMLQRQERRNNAMLEDIRNEENPLKPGQKYHPFEMFGGSTDYAAEVASREPVSMSNPAPQRDDRYKNPAYSQQNPLVNRDDRYKNPAYSQQTPISQVDQVRKDVNTEVNDVLSQVSIPGASQNSDILDRAPINATPVPSRRRVRNQKPAPLDIPARTWPDYTGY